MRSLPRRVVFSLPREGRRTDLEKEAKVYTLDESSFEIGEAISPPGVLVEPVEVNSNRCVYRIKVFDLDLLTAQSNPVVAFKTNRPDEPEFQIEILLR
jgi:hypothetical protein